MNQSNQKKQQEFDAQVDASNLFCPLPVLRAKQALDQMSDKAILKLIATDPNSEKDIQAFVDQAGHKLIDTQHDESTFVFFIENIIA